MAKNLTKPWFVGRGIHELAKSLARAMFFWGRSGFKIVPYYTCWKRRFICHLCTGGVGKRCPVCGCFLVAITKLASSHCANWNQYLEAPTYQIVQEAGWIQPTED